MSILHTEYLKEKIPYTGAELAPQWISARTGVFASSIVAFRGACFVNTSELVDLEDQREGETIQAKEMLHFLGEWFENDLSLGIARQLLFIAGFADLVNARITGGQRVIRKGNDLYVEDSSAGVVGKLSVSIVTASPISTLFHFGVNIDPTGAPVSAVGLSALDIDPDALAKDALALWNREWAGMAKARCKVMAR
ncbi:MAG: DUF366 family protein [Bdellovibrionota bacterium]